MTNRTAVYLTPEDPDSTLHPGNRARPAGGRVVREEMTMETNKAANRQSIGWYKDSQHAICPWIVLRFGHAVRSSQWFYQFELGTVL